MFQSLHQMTQGPPGGPFRHYYLVVPPGGHYHKLPLVPFTSKPPLNPPKRVGLLCNPPFQNTPLFMGFYVYAWVLCIQLSERLGISFTYLNIICWSPS